MITFCFVCRLSLWRIYFLLLLRKMKEFDEEEGVNGGKVLI